MTARKVLICVAIRMEADAIARTLGLTFDPTRTRAWAMVNETAVDLVLIGVSACRMPKDLDTAMYGLVISAGLAGALDPQLRCGDVVVDGDVTEVPDRAKRGRICGADAVIATAVEKARLFRETGAVAVDMESNHVRTIAKRHAIPFIAVRAVSDEADEAIDPAVLGLVDPMGEAKPLAIASTLARRPSLLPTLMRFRSRSNHALAQLGLVLRNLLESG